MEAACCRTAAAGGTEGQRNRRGCGVWLPKGQPVCRGVGDLCGGESPPNGRLARGQGTNKWTFRTGLNIHSGGCLVWDRIVTGWVFGFRQNLQQMHVLPPAKPAPSGCFALGQTASGWRFRPMRVRHRRAFTPGAAHVKMRKRKHSGPRTEGRHAFDSGDGRADHIPQ